MNRVSITECFIKGKAKDESLCEDAIFVGKRFIAVIDGVTSKTSTTYEGKTTGKYASEVIIKEFEKLESVDELGVINPQQVLVLLDKAIRESVGTADLLPLQDYPRASVVFCDIDYAVIVSYGDCKCRIGDVVFDNEKRIDSVLSKKRSEVLIDCLNTGESIEKLRNDDPGRKAIKDDLLKQFVHENKSDDSFGYPVLNGCGINSKMLKVYDIEYGTPIILCTDGYPLIRRTLSESETVLNEILTEDPLLIGKNSYRFRTTKGLKKDANSFDDRAWIEFIITDE